MREGTYLSNHTSSSPLLSHNASPTYDLPLPSFPQRLCFRGREVLFIAEIHRTASTYGAERRVVYHPTHGTTHFFNTFVLRLTGIHHPSSATQSIVCCYCPSAMICNACGELAACCQSPFAMISDACVIISRVEVRLLSFPSRLSFFHSLIDTTLRQFLMSGRVQLSSIRV